MNGPAYSTDYLNKLQWRVATRKIGSDDGKWDIGKTPMTANHATSVAKSLNRVYPEYQHQAVCVRDNVKRK